jgi:hypothetical protein
MAPTVATAEDLLPVDGAATAGAATTKAPTTITVVDATILPLTAAPNPKTLIFAPGEQLIPAAPRRGPVTSTAQAA